ncbi:MAG: lactate utilization protein [Anaerovoracaceae bacterium]
MSEIVKKADKVRLETIVKNLKKRNITGHYCETKEDAVKVIESLIVDGSEVSWGGSATLDEIGIKDILKSGNYEVNDPMEIREDRITTIELRRKALTCDVFLSSANAVTMDGEIVNIDGTGNRVAAIAFGPKKVILVAGVNKVVNEEKDAVGRIKTNACPPNCIRLGKKTPCAVTGKCGDCLSVGNTICSYTVVTRFSPEEDRLHVVLVNENLGF